MGRNVPEAGPHLREAPAGAPPWALGLCSKGGPVAMTAAASRASGEGFVQPGPC